MSNAKSSEASRPVLSFGAAEKRIAEQIELTWLISNRPERSEVYRELTRIIADVYCHGWSRPVVVDGEEVTFGYLQELYKHLTAEHVDYVLDRLERYPREINHKKAFIRTALVNSIVEMQTETENLYARSRA